MRLAIALALLALALPAQAQDGSPQQGLPNVDADVELGSGLVCDTREQVERYVELDRGDPKAAADAVNKEVGQEEACTFGTIAFIRGADVARLRNHEDKPLKIAEVLVLGVATEGGLVQIQPVRWYTVFPIEEIQV